MSKIFVGYGEYRGYRLNEIPTELLQMLARRYPLNVAGNSAPAYKDLFVTVAIHAEIKRRDDGGKATPHIPSIRKLAEEIVEKGFQRTSKSYHPDTQGQHGSQVLLGQTRTLLIKNCKDLPDFDSDKDAIIILSNGLKELEDDFEGMNISDDDIPF